MKVKTLFYLIYKMRV